jgi:hypothetical protein
MTARAPSPTRTAALAAGGWGLALALFLPLFTPGTALAADGAAAPAPGAQPPAAVHAAGTTLHPAARPVEPTWMHLNAEQRDALGPLAGQWDSFDAIRKKRWLEIAVHYKDLSPEAQQRMHERMPELARLTPQERAAARENFRKAYSLPADKRKELTQQFQELPEDSKHALADRSPYSQAQPPRRVGTSAPVPAKAGTAAAAPAPAPAAAPSAPPPVPGATR